MSLTEYNARAVGEVGFHKAHTDHRHGIVAIDQRSGGRIDLNVSFLNGSCTVITAELTWMGSQLRQQLDKTLPPGKAILQLVAEDRPVLDAESLANSGVVQSRHLSAVVGVLEDRDLLPKAYEAADLHVRGYTAERLLEAGYRTKQLYEAGFSAEEQLNAAGYSAQNFRTLQRELSSLAIARHWQSIDEQRFREAKTQIQKFYLLVSQLISEAGCSLAELRGAGCWSDVLRCSPPQLRQAGFSVAELMEEEMRPTAFFFRHGGYPVHELLDAGYTEQELRRGGFKGGFTEQELREARLVGSALHEAGFSNKR